MIPASSMPAILAASEELADLPRLDFSGLRAVESFGWRENAENWRRIAARCFESDFERCCYAQRLAFLCETFAAEVEAGL